MRFQIQHQVDPNPENATYGQKMFYAIEKVIRHSGKYGYNTLGKFQTREEAEAAIKARAAG